MNALYPVAVQHFSPDDLVWMLGGNGKVSNGLMIAFKIIVGLFNVFCSVAQLSITQPTPPFNATDQEHADISLQLHSARILCQGV